MAPRIFYLIACVLLASTASASGATLNFIDEAADDFRLETISGLDIGGSTYDVFFTHGASFNDLGDNAVEFAGQADAAVADQAIRDFVNSLAVDASASTSYGVTNVYLIPHTELFDGVSFSESSFRNQDRNPLAYRDGIDYLFAFNHWTLGQNVAWVTFAETEEPLPAVPFHQNPVPGSVIMLGMTALTAGGIRWVGQRRRHAA